MPVSVRAVVMGIMAPSPTSCGAWLFGGVSHHCQGNQARVWLFQGITHDRSTTRPPGRPTVSIWDCQGKIVLITGGARGSELGSQRFSKTSALSR